MRFTISLSMSNHYANSGYRRGRGTRRRRKKKTFRQSFWRFVKSGRFIVSLFALAAVFLFTISAVTLVKRALFHKPVEEELIDAEDSESEEDLYSMEDVEIEVADPVDPEVASFAPGNTFERTKKTKKIPAFKEDGTGSTIVSGNAVLVDLDNGTIVCERDADAVIPPASMTKIMTLLVASEHLDQEDLEDTYILRGDTLSYAYNNGCSVVGFLENEKVTIADLMYGTILPSGADAVIGLCNVVAGGHDQFVELMNDKLEELGLSDTAHFTNAVGIYDDNHHCTVLDIAVILKNALYSETNREVLRARTYTTRKTKKHPSGITISNLFLRRIEDKPLPGSAEGAKTGFVNQSGNCAASYLVTPDNRHYICVTAHSTSAWRCIYDHVDIYNQFVKPAKSNSED